MGLYAESRTRYAVDVRLTIKTRTSPSATHKQKRGRGADRLEKGRLIVLCGAAAGAAHICIQIFIVAAAVAADAYSTPYVIIILRRRRRSGVEAEHSTLLLTFTIMSTVMIIDYRIPVLYLCCGAPYPTLLFIF